jgi:hypothetical protein
MSSNSGCCGWLKRCFKSKPIKENTNPTVTNPPNRQIVNDSQAGGREAQQVNYSRVVNNNPVSIRNIPVNNTAGDDYIMQRIELLKIKFKINSKYERPEIESTAESNNIHKFNCPICFKYYNHVLKISCCGNFICLLCAEDYVTTHIKYEFNIKCPFCGFDDNTIILNDVADNEEPKYYTDSPLLCVKKSNKQMGCSIIVLEQMKESQTEGGNPNNKIEEEINKFAEDIMDKIVIKSNITDLDNNDADKVIEHKPTQNISLD